MIHKEKMLVEAICDGTVLDHIPSNKLFAIIHLLGLDQLDTPVTIGCNLESQRLGRKGVVKMADKFFSEDEINRIAIIAPQIQLNIIRDYKVVSKKILSVPEKVLGIVRCPNAKCITNAEPMPSNFSVATDGIGIELQCYYCGRKVEGDSVTLI